MSVLAVLGGISAVSSITGSISEAGAIKSQAAYESQQLQMNSKLADLQAKSAIRVGKENAENYRRQVKQTIGSQRAIMAAQGIDISTGSALDIQTDTAEWGAVDALTIKNNAFREAAGYKIEAIGYRGQADFTTSAAKYRARNTLISGGLSAINQGFQTYALAGGGGGSSTVKGTTPPGYRGSKTYFN